MDINKGFNTDTEPINLPSGSWVQAKNIIRQVGKGIKTHKGFDLIPNSIIGNIIGKIELESLTILFHYDTSSFTISKYNGSAITTILNINTPACLTYLGINSSTRISGTYTYNYKGDIIISFFDYIGKGKPFLINIDDLPIATFDTVDKVDLLLLQSSFKTPFFNVTESFKGGNLKCGRYQFAIAYEINDFDFTAPSLFSEPVFIGDFKYRNIKTSYFTTAGVFTPLTSIENCSLSSNYGQTTNTAINLLIHNLDSKYSRFKLLVLFSTGESNEAYTTGIYNVPNTNSLNITVTGNELYSESYETLSSNRSNFNGISSLTSFQNKLSFGGLKYEDDEIWLNNDKTITYQQYANYVKLKFDIDVVPESDFDIKSSISQTNVLFHNNKAEFCFQYSTFQPDEVYAFYIAFGKGNKISKAYHIPGREVKTIAFYAATPSVYNTFDENRDVNTLSIYGGVASNNPLYFPIEDNEKLLHSSYVGWYQIRDTSNLTTKELGYWENRDEVYQSGDSSIVRDTDGYVVGDLSGEYVRHHKMPSFATCYGSQGWSEQTNLNYRITVTFDYSTIGLPSAITENYDTIYLLYADRTYDESTILGMSPLFSDRTVFSSQEYAFPETLKDLDINSRFYDFGLNAIKPNIVPDYLKIEALLENRTGRIFGEFGDPALLEKLYHNVDRSLTLTKTHVPYMNKIRIVNGYNYVEEGDSTTSPKNVLDFNADDTLILENREAVLQLFSSEEESSFVEGTTVNVINPPTYSELWLIYKNISLSVEQVLTINTGSVDNALYLATLKSFKTSVCVNYNLKNLVLANCIHKTDRTVKNGILIEDIINDTVPSGLAFTGDCFINNDFIRTRVAYYTKKDSDYLQGSFLIHSFGYIYPNYSRVNSCFRIDNKSMYENETYSYNTIFSQRNSINLFQPSNPELTNQLEVKTRFTRSAVLGSESKEIGWRIFNLLDYFDFPTTAGEFTYIFGGDLSIMFGFTNDIYVAEIKETLETGTGNTLALRTNNLFDTSPIRITDIFERSVHIATQDHIFITKFGFVFYDNINKNIYLFDGKTVPLAISKLGIDKYFKGLTSVSKLVGGYDEETDHIFFTLQPSNDSWSFYLTEKQIVSQYDFVLNHYFVNKGRLYGVDTLNNIVGFNGTGYAYYSTTQNQSYIDILFTDIPQLSKLVESIVWNEKTTISGANNFNNHVTDVIVYNEFQCAVIRVFGDYIKYINGSWHWNNIKDAKRTSVYYWPSDTLDYEKLAYVPLPQNAFTIANPNETYYVEDGSATYNGRTYTTGDKIRTTNQSAITIPANSIVYFLKNWFDKSNIICKFAVIRVILNDADTSNKEVILNDLIVNYSKSI